MALSQLTEVHGVRQTYIKAVIAKDDEATETEHEYAGFVVRIDVVWGATNPDSSCTITIEDEKDLDATAGNLASVNGTGADLSFLPSDLGNGVPVLGKLTFGNSNFGTTNSTATVHVYVSRYGPH